MRRFLLSMTSVLFVAGSGCWSGTMKPGADCLRCHDGSDGTRLSVAGTIFTSPTAGEEGGLRDILIDLADSKGRVVSLASNEVGNFYTEEPLAPPLQVTLSRPGGASVSTVAPSGNCNSCHAGGSSLGRIYLP